ncbi:MAG: hypothetical protein MUC87_15690 [Bacteroidia bacterium]|nr:hypothetical protein [Bacteroidia bacterium]
MKRPSYLRPAMKVTVIIKEVNARFRQDIADKYNDGKESADNMRYNWEDEYAVKTDVTSFKVRNNVPYQLRGWKGDEEFSIEIPGMMIVDCQHEDNSITQFAFSRKYVKDTKKADRPNGDIRFFVFVSDNKTAVSPQPGIYILQNEWPSELPVPEAVEPDDDEDFDPEDDTDDSEE